MSVCKTYISCHDIPCHQESCDKSMNYMRKACAGLKQEMSVTKHIFASRLWMVMSQSVQGVACNKELQRANKSGTFVNSSNGTYFSPRSLSDRLSRRNDGLIPAWTSQVMVYSYTFLIFLSEIKNASLRRRWVGHQPAGFSRLRMCSSLSCSSLASEGASVSGS